MHTQQGLVVRRGAPDDVSACSKICFEAFGDIADRHNFPRDFPSPEAPQPFMEMMFTHPEFYTVVAESEGTIVGSNCLDERSAIPGIGPLTVDPHEQNHGVGRELMNAVLARAEELRAPGIRLVQAAYHNRSLSLYTKLGFSVREPLSLMQGTLSVRNKGYNVRPVAGDDAELCNQLCRRVHGHDRRGELRDAIQQGWAALVERNERITGYTSCVGFIGHSVAETNDDLKALIASAPNFMGPGFLLPTRNAELLRWCLEQGLRVIQPMNLMTIGLYNEPSGAYLPSITF